MPARSMSRPSPAHLAGPNRYDTAALLLGTYPDRVYVASWMNWPDALTGAARAGADHEPMALTRSQAMTVP